jgi:hypothetical protein
MNPQSQILSIGEAASAPSKPEHQLQLNVRIRRVKQSGQFIRNNGFQLIPAACDADKKLLLHSQFEMGDRSG